ncbi:MAG TPA: GGDEF domain-containing protein, partial [Pararhizobium sp.]|nr:GGDEF domain-containing protein [Pararhizobium sp.]
SWGLANILLGVALIGYMYMSLLPLALRVILPNGLLIAGLGMRWRAAREFGGRSSPLLVILGPTVLFGFLCVVPALLASHALIFMAANVLLAGLAAASAWEFFRDREDGLPSRYGLVAAYFVMAASFAARILQGIVAGTAMHQYLPHDTMLTVHLIVGLFFTVASGTFALSVAYERNARNLRAVAMHDSLTGLLNRGAFEAQLRHLLANPICGGFAVLVFDIDHFKLVNDRYGHAAGDAALRACAEICRSAMAGRGTIARIGGEEFAAVVKHVSPEEALATAEAVREAVKATTLTVGGHSFGLTISAGMCHSETGIRDFDELMRRADSGLYAAKHKGRDRVEPIAEGTGAVALDSEALRLPPALTDSHEAPDKTDHALTAHLRAG